MNKQTKKVKKPDSKKRAFLIGIGVAALGAVTYFGWRYWNRNKSLKQEESPVTPVPEISLPTPTHKKKTASSAPLANDEFPLKKGSKGENVKALQQALVAKYGKSILPKYGADGDFGSELIVALKKVGLPAQINQSTFNVLVAGSSVDARKIAMDLYKAASSKDFPKALASLQQINNTQDYKAVNADFLNYRVGGNVRQTLVTGLSNAFSEAAQKDKLRMEFLRIGLNYDGNKWSLSGIDSQVIITTKATQVWKDKTTSVPVPPNMVLGREVSRKIGYVLFENAGQHFLVPTSAIQPYIS